MNENQLKKLVLCAVLMLNGAALAAAVQQQHYGTCVFIALLNFRATLMIVLIK